ncbi:hypothetical protein SO802_017753 [Lithocarpus litseifolius]|uniref:Uncharacterized protein n=1 Tax=Lithocarpus litseifolius TaxID=425828 RepID=A0AAW2CIW3_9ROSI
MPSSIVPPTSTKPPSAQVINLDLSNPVKVPSKPAETTSSKPPRSIPMTLLKNEDLAWEKFQQVVDDEDIFVCYEMSLKEFKHSTVHDLFKVMSKFIAASKQATEIDHERVRLEAKICDMEKESSPKTGERMKLEAEVEELKNLVEELRMDIVEKDTRLDHLQKQNEELRSTSKQVKDKVIKEFKSSKAFTVLLDTNYAVGFEDFVWTLLSCSQR